MSQVRPVAPSRARRRLPIVGVAAAVAAVVLYLLVTAFLARQHLEQARAAVLRVKADVLDDKQAQATTYLKQAEADASAAANLTAGPLWAGLADVPYLGDPLATVRGIASTARELTRTVLPQVVQAADGLSPRQLRTAGNKINLAALQRAEPALTRADAATTTAQQHLDTLPTHTWLPPANTATRQFTGLLGQLKTTLADSTAAAKLIPPMLGGQGARRYLLVFENDAESRGLGGLPGAFAIVKADKGTLTFERFGNDSDIKASATNTMPNDFQDAWGGYGAQQLFVNSDISPHFPDAAQIWMSMWQRQFRQQLDGAIATDPTALSYLLAVTGPTKTQDGTPVTAGNVVALTENTAYFRYPSLKDAPARKRFLLVVARAAADKVVHGGGSAHALLKALGHAVGERRLLVWSAHRDEERQLAGLPLGGTVPTTTQPFVAVVINNGGGNKLDYYLDRTVGYRADSCAGTRRKSTVTVRLDNDAPTRGLPAYVDVRADNPSGNVVPGSNRLLVTLIATSGAGMTQVSLDGAPTTAIVGRELGHPMFTATVDVNPRQARTLVFHLDEPRTMGAVTTVAQPLVRPLRQDLRDPSC